MALSNYGNGPINDAQQRLYERLMRSVEEEEARTRKNINESVTGLSPEEKEEIERMKTIRKDEREKARVRRREDFFREKKKAEEARVEKMKDFVISEKKKKRKDTLDRLVKQTKLRIHQFFHLDPESGTERRLTDVVYFGCATLCGRAWVPHGQGKLVGPNGTTLYEGCFHSGRMHGNGKYRFTNGNVWSGQFRMDKLHGIGEYDSTSGDKSHALRKDGKGPELSRKDAIFYNNKKVCFADELKPGISIDFLGGNTCGGGVILGRGKKRGHFKVKTDEGTVEERHLVSERFRINLSKVTTVMLPNDNATADWRKVSAVSHEHQYCNQGLFVPSTMTKYDENFFSSTNEEKEEQEKRAAVNRRRQHIVEYELSRERQKRQVEVEEELASAKLMREEAEMRATKDAALHVENLMRRKQELIDKHLFEQAKILKSRADFQREFSRA